MNRTKVNGSRFGWKILSVGVLVVSGVIAWRMVEPVLRTQPRPEGVPAAKEVAKPAVTAEGLTTEEELEWQTVLGLWEKAQQSKQDSAKAKSLIQEMLTRSHELKPKMGQVLRFWTLRGWGAVEMNDAFAGVEAAYRLTKLNAAESPDTDVLDLMVILKRKGWNARAWEDKQSALEEAEVGRQETLEPRNKEANRVGVAIETNTVGMGLVRIAAGSFTMGSPASEPERGDKEVSHTVRISKDFYMGCTEVTQAQWKTVMGTTPSYFSGDDLPVEKVNWEDAVEFCRKLSQKEGKRYRLPTEAEWEYACRAGTTTAFNWGTDSIGTKQSNYNGDTAYNKGPIGVDRDKTTPVRSFKPNDWGLYDMHGNVWEWCSDWYADYPAGTVTDPTGPLSGTTRVLRGGSWYNNPRRLRSASRVNDANPGLRMSYIGFRVCRDL
jgi:formylglycine-generating enzyme required for sulfatase activity